MTVFAVRVKEIDAYRFHVYLVDAKNENHAKNIGEAKWYESHTPRIAEGETQVWEVDADFTNRDNPSVRT